MAIEKDWIEKEKRVKKGQHIDLNLPPLIRTIKMKE